MSITTETASRHWATELIGRPFWPGEEGPHRFDCWGLVRFIYATRYGLELPQYPINHANTAAVAGAITQTLNGDDWHRVVAMEEGDVAVMGSNSRLHHVGIWIASNGGLVLHATRPTVTAQTLDQLRVRGLPNVQFYRYRNGNNRSHHQPV